MTSIIKSASDATSSVFTTVGTLASQITRTVDTAGQGLDMLNSFVTTARTKQIARTAIDLETFYDELIEETSIDNAKRQLELVTTLSQNPELKKLYSENENKLQTIIASLRTETLPTT